MSYSLDDPPNSRLFIVAGRNTSAEFLRNVFEQYGSVSFVKYLRDKGVAYVKYDRASSAALAIENLHEVTLNDGQGPRLKVLLAESPHTRHLPGLHLRRPEEESMTDPDNSPPRSRLFLVVPKNADGTVIEAEMARYSGMQYCKTDLVASKGIVFVKYSTSSSAMLAMETVQSTGTLAGYKVKIMLAEPKSRRSDMPQFLPGVMGSRGPLQPELIPGLGFMSPSQPNAALLSSLTPNLLNSSMGMQDYAALQSGMPNLTGNFSGMASFGGPAGLRGHTPPLDPSLLQGQPAMFDHEFILGGGGSNSFNNLGSATHSGSSYEGLSKTRLFVVVHKQAADEAVARLFQMFPGMEYIDIKKDRATGRSKGYAYVGYSTPEAAAAAQMQLNGIDYPLGTGCKLKVMFAEPLGMSRSQSRSEEGNSGMQGAAGSSIHEAIGSKSSTLVNGSTGGGSASTGNLLTVTPTTQDTAMTTFHLPSPASADSVSHSTYNLNSARTDPGSVGYETAPSTHSSPLRLGSLDSGATGLEADLAAVQAGLAGMGLSLDLNGSGQGLGSSTVSQHITPRSVGWRESSPESGSAGVTRVHSAGTSPAVSARRNSDDTVVYSALHRPLPEYALSHVFSRCGTVEYVRMMEDQRVAMVKYSNAGAAKMAMTTLDGAEVLGEVLHVRQSPPPYAKGLAAAATTGLQQASSIVVAPATSF